MGSLTIILVSILANAGGIGGGALLTPIYIWLFNFSVEDAIPLSKMTIFTGAIVNYFLLHNARLDGAPNRPLINYRMAGLLIPMLLAGTVVGVFGAKVFPPVLILSFLLIFLMISIVKMFGKGVKMWKKETEQLKRENENEADLDETESLLDEKSPISQLQNEAMVRADFKEFEKENRYQYTKSGSIFQSNPELTQNPKKSKFNGNGNRLFNSTDNDKNPQKTGSAQTLENIPNQNSQPEYVLDSDSKGNCKGQNSESQSHGVNPFWVSNSNPRSRKLGFKNSGVSKMKKSIFNLLLYGPGFTDYLTRFSNNLQFVN